jgi:hypothetical protein
MGKKFIWAKMNVHGAIPILLCKNELKIRKKSWGGFLWVKSW